MADMFLSGPEQGRLAARVRDGDREAEDELVRAFSTRTFALLYARTHDAEAARDLLQEVMMVSLLAVRQGQVREPERLGVFILGTAQNLANNHFRKRGRRPEEPLSEDLEIPSPAEDPNALARKQLLQRALQEMDSVDRKILSLTLVDGIGPGEIANRLGLGADVVRQRKSRAVKKVIESVRRMSQVVLRRPHQVG